MKKLIIIAASLLSFSAIYSMDKGESPAKNTFSTSDMRASLGEIEIKPEAKRSYYYEGNEVDEFSQIIERKVKAAGSSSSSQADKAVVPSQTAPVLPYPRCYFSNDIKAAFLNCIANEQKGMRGAWYRFTLYDAASAMVKGMKERNMTIKLVIDEKHLTDDFCSPLRQVINNGGTVFKITQKGFSHNPGNFEIMHHKFMIFRKNVNDKKLLWTGSWNATGQASSKNWEDALIIDDSETIARYEERMTELEKHSVAIQSNQCVSGKDTDPSINFARRMNGIPQLSQY